MKNLKSALLIALMAFNVPSLAYAESSLGKVSKNSQTQTQSMIAQTNNELIRVMSGLRNYYSTSLGWPTSISQISNYYSGDFKTPLGTIKGHLSASRYELVIDINTSDEQTVALVKSMSTKLKGTYNESTKQVVIPVDTPQEAAIVSSMLSRLPDTTGSGLNTMRADLDMGNNDINNAKEINATVIRGTSFEASTVNAEQFSGTVADLTTVNSSTINTQLLNAQQISSTTNLINLNSNTKVNGALEIAGAASFSGAITQNDGQQANLGNLNVKNNANFAGSIDQASGQQANLGILTAQKATINEFYVNGVAYFSNGLKTATGVQIADEHGKLFYAGQDLDARYLGADAVAADSSKLGGVEYSRYARTDISNVFSQPQVFNSSISAENMYTSGDISVNNILLRSKGYYLSSLYDDVKSNTKRIEVLENKVNTTSGNQMGKWVKTGSYTSSGSSCFGINSAVYYINFNSSPNTTNAECVAGLKGYFIQGVGSNGCGWAYYECQ